jgi:hypothetical protein
MDWYSKKQATVDTATFGSKFITARTTINQIIDLQMTLCYASWHSYLRKELCLWRQQDRYRRLINPTCQATQETQHSIIPSCTRGSCFQVCYDLPSARQIQSCQHSQQALGLCFGMVNHECPSICSRRYMGSFR